MEFVIEESKDRSTWVEAVSFPGARNRYYTPDADPPGTTYYIRFCRRGVDGWGPWSDVVSAATRATALYPVEGLRVNAEYTVKRGDDLAKIAGPSA